MNVVIKYVWFVDKCYGLLLIDVEMILIFVLWFKNKILNGLVLIMIFLIFNVFI